MFAADIGTVGGGLGLFIGDFSIAGGDKLDLSEIDADLSQDGDQAFVLVDALSGVAGQAAVAFDGESTRVLLDVDGDGQSDFDIVLAGHIALTETGLVL